MSNSAKVSTLLLVLILAVSCAACFLILRNSRMVCAVNQEEQAGWNDADKQLDFAETLANKGMKQEALNAFDDYLKIAKISAMEAAKLLYRMGNMYMDLMDYQKAAYYFYKSESADPDAGFKSELNDKLVECLENLGMDTQANYELASKDSLSPESAQDEASAVLAKVGDYQITQREIDDAINAMPDWAKENFNSGDGKVEFVRQYATTQALYEKAKKMGLERDSDVRRSLKDVTKQLLVQKLLEKELKSKVSADPAQLNAFYEANKDKYKENAYTKVSVIKISDEKKAQDSARRLAVGADFAKMAQELSEDEITKKTGGAIEGEVEKSGLIPGVGISKEAADMIFSKKEGEIAGPVKVDSAYYIFKVTGINQEKVKPFEDVKEQVEYEYKSKKAQAEMQSLVKDIMQEQQVEIFTDKILQKVQKEESAPPAGEEKKPGL